MKYMLLIYQNPANWQELPDGERDDPLAVHARVEDVEIAHAREVVDGLPVGADALTHDPLALRGSSPRSRAAISRLATRRLTSHSHGPGSVSSKSFRSKTSRRSGEAKAPKFDR